MKHVFVSYSRTDAVLAEQIAQACVQHGATCFKDDRSLELGTDWHDDIVAAVSRADLFLLLVSKSSLRSRVVNQELGMARMAGAAVIPLLLVDPASLPTEIARLNGVALEGANSIKITQTVGKILAAAEKLIPVLPVDLAAIVGDEPSVRDFLHSIPAAINAPAFATSGRGAVHVQCLLGLVDWLLLDEAKAKLTRADIILLTAALVLRERLWYMPLSALAQLVSTEPCATLWRYFRANRRSAGVPVWQQDEAMPLNGVPSEAVEAFISSNIGILAFESAMHPPDDFQLPQAFLSILPHQRLRWAALIARADESSLRNWIETSIPVQGERRLAKGGRPVIVAGGLCCAWQLSQYADRPITSYSLIPKEPDGCLQELRYDLVTDRHSLEVIAVPRSGVEYENVLEWIDATQTRIDEVWAVWSQIYGEGQFGLRIRTVTSELRDENEFAREHQLHFEPRPARLTAASANLLRQLCEPLYGAKPEVGVREMMQNAIDAVRERHAWPYPANDVKSLDFDADVLVSLVDQGDEQSPEERYWFEVSDRGVGMTPDTIRQFFLTVGASFRDSQEWIGLYAADHPPKIMRSGRFGIGVIATFLLSNEIHVSTRHVTETDGVGTRFLARLNDLPVELIREPLPLGTTIRLPLSKEVFEELLTPDKFHDRREDVWDWYGLSDPKVVRIIRIGENSEVLTPALDETEDSLARMPWRNITIDGFDNFFWRPGQKSACRRLWCNGIRVLQEHRTVWTRYDYMSGRSAWSLKEVDALVFDSLGTLPINLARDGLTRPAPYNSMLRRNILLDHCAWLLFRASLGPAMPIAVPPVWTNTYYNSGQGDGVVKGPAYVKTQSGIIPFLSHQIFRSPLKSLLIHSDLDTPVDFLGGAFASIVDVNVMGGFHPETRTSAAVRMLTEFLSGNVPVATLSILTNFPGDAPDLVDVPGLEGWRRPESDAEATPWLIDFIGRIPSEKSNVFVAIVDIDHSSEPKSDDLSEIFEELALPPIIPYDTDERARSCGQALLLLDEAVRRHEGEHDAQKKERIGNSE